MAPTETAPASAPSSPSLLTKRRLSDPSTNETLSHSAPVAMEEAPSAKRACLPSIPRSQSAGDIIQSHSKPPSRVLSLQSPNRQSLFRFASAVPAQRGSIVHKVTRTNTQQGTETTLYTISITRPIPSRGETSRPVISPIVTADHSSTPPTRSTMDYLTDAAVSELKKPDLQSPPRAALHSVENLHRLKCSGVNFRVKTFSSTGPSPVTFQTLPTLPPSSSSEPEAIKRFTFVFK